eukprot:TRINITY_DN8216_c0_g1_i6.p2 TRINITY_DN8216_c0_g1~~TRINITY_DN8216_c0_g1_i6.p2  ORF type:complete len:102 (+),score=37.56 TRINITY_DN8216_c0_g1_i6:578-883(+)
MKEMLRKRDLLRDEQQELNKKIKLEARKTRRLMAKSGKRLSAAELIELLRAKTQATPKREKADKKTNVGKRRKAREATHPDMLDQKIFDAKASSSADSSAP